MAHGGDIYRNKVKQDHSVSLNPNGTPEAVLCALKDAKDASGAYPDPMQERVRERIAKTVGVDASCVVAGNGASELLLAAVRSAMPEKAFLFEPSFTGYAHVLNACGCEILRHTLKRENGFAVTFEDAEAVPDDADPVLLCDPGNPSGRRIPEDVLEAILTRARENAQTVIIDESFLALSEPAERAAKILAAHENVILIRSLTKLFAIPGVRAGYALSSKEQIEKITAQLPEWNLSCYGEAAIVAGMDVLNETDYLKDSLALIKNERNYLMRALHMLGLKSYESVSCYLLFSGPKELGGELLRRGILIRECGDFYGLTDRDYRIGIRTHEENAALMEAVRDCLCHLKR